MAIRATSPPPRGGSLAVRLLLAFGALLTARALYLALANRVALLAVLGLRFAGVAALLALALGVTALALHGELRRPARPAPRPAAALRALLSVIVLAWLVFVGSVQPFQRLWFDLALGLVPGAWAGVLLALGAAAGRGRPARLVERAAFGLSLAVVAAELTLRLVAAVHPSPLLVRGGSAPRRTIERFRCAPGQVRFGFPCNARGFYDEPFFRKGAGEELVASIGDSFNVGSVPHSHHMTTVCERALGVRVDNIGVAGIGPPEYLALLADVALPLEPDVVVINVFVGNDLTVADPDAELPDAGLRAWLERSRVLLWVLPRRLARVAAERSRGGGRAAGVLGVGGEQHVPDRERVAAASFPWLTDPSLEQPGLSADAFLRLETQRALDVCARDAASLPLTRRVLREARRVLGRTPLLVVLIPDEFQVEDELWARVQAGTNVPLDRDRPQHTLTAWLAGEGIACLDLLPVLRAEPPLADGRRHLFHLQDTHFNARGNRVAGEALAEALAPLLAGEE